MRIVFLIMVLRMFFLYGMELEEPQLISHSVQLTIFPDMYYMHNGVNYVFAVLSNYSSDQNKIILHEVPSEEFVYHNIRYTSAELMKGLEEKIVDQYPLHWHKKITYLDDNQDCVVFTCDAFNHFETLFIPKKICTGFLQYLKKDVVAVGRTSFDTFREIIGSRLSKHDRNKPLLSYFDFNAEKYYDSGDMLVFFNSIPFDKDQKSYFIGLQEYALSLGRDLCLFKKDRAWRVSKIQDMLNKYSGCARLDQRILHIKEFTDSPFLQLLCRDICLTIYANRDVLYKHNNTMCVSVMLAYLSGFRYQSNQVNLRSDVVLSKIINHKETSISADVWLKRLMNKKTSRHYLMLHENMQYFVGDERLKVVMHYSKQDRYEISLSLDTKNRLLRYLCNGKQQDDSFDFCSAVGLCEYEKYVDALVPYNHQYDLCDEDDLQPGDVIALGSDNAIKHYALVLDEDVYLSKWGRSGLLLVSSLQAMMDAFVCKNFVVLEPIITEYQRFWNQRFSVDSDIRFS